MAKDNTPITKKIENNKQTITVPQRFVETEVINNGVFPKKDKVDAGVVIGVGR